MNTYKVLLVKYVKGCENEPDDPYHVRLVHPLELPFVPVPDMWISDGDLYELITHLEWDVQKEQFVAQTPEDDEIEEANVLRKDHRPLGMVVRDYIEKGWDTEEVEEGEEE